MTNGSETMVKSGSEMMGESSGVMVEEQSGDLVAEESSCGGAVKSGSEIEAENKSAVIVWKSGEWENVGMVDLEYVGTEKNQYVQERRVGWKENNQERAKDQVDRETEGKMRVWKKMENGEVDIIEKQGAVTGDVGMVGDKQYGIRNNNFQPVSEEKLRLKTRKVNESNQSANKQIKPIKKNSNEKDSKEMNIKERKTPGDSHERMGIGDSHQRTGMGDSHERTGIGDSHERTGIGDSHERMGIGDSYEENHAFIKEPVQSGWMIELMRSVQLRLDNEAREVYGVRTTNNVEGNNAEKNLVRQLLSRHLGPIIEEELAFGGEMDGEVSRALCKLGLDQMIGDSEMIAEQRAEVELLIYTGRDLFVIDPMEMPTTDLVMHTISTYNDTRLVRTKEIVYSQLEIQWQQENIPKLLKAGVISHCNSLWSAQTKYRMTIKSNYPIRQMGPILNMLSQEKYWKEPKFQADVVNSYYAVPMWPTHAYKMAFSCSVGQFCYNVMGISSRAQRDDLSVRDEMMGAIMTSQDLTGTRFNQDVEDWHVWVTMARREKQQDQARGRILEEQDRQIEAREQEVAEVQLQAEWRGQDI